MSCKSMFPLLWWGMERGRELLPPVLLPYFCFLLWLLEMEVSDSRQTVWWLCHTYSIQVLLPFLWWNMALNITTEVFVLLYLGTAAAAPEIFSLHLLFVWMGTCRGWRIGSTDAGEGAVWWGSLEGPDGDSPCAERSLPPAECWALLLPPFLSSMNICLAGLLPCSSSCGRQTSPRAGTSLQPPPCPLLPAASLAEAAWSPGCCSTAPGLVCSLPMPLPHCTRAVPSPRAAELPRRAKLLPAAECHLLLPNCSQNSFLPGVPWSGESKSCSEQAGFSVDGEETQQFLLGSRVCDAGGLQD